MLVAWASPSYAAGPAMTIDIRRALGRVPHHATRPLTSQPANGAPVITLRHRSNATCVLPIDVMLRGTPAPCQATPVNHPRRLSIKLSLLAEPTQARMRTGTVTLTQGSHRHHARQFRLVGVWHAAPHIRNVFALAIAAHCRRRYLRRAPALQTRGSGIEPSPPLNTVDPLRVIVVRSNQQLTDAKQHWQRRDRARRAERPHRCVPKMQTCEPGLEALADGQLWAPQ